MDALRIFDSTFIEDNAMERQRRAHLNDNEANLLKIKDLLQSEREPEVLEEGSALCLRGDQGCVLVILVSGSLRFRRPDNGQAAATENGVLSANGPVVVLSCRTATEIVAETRAELFLVPLDLADAHSDQDRAIAFQLCSYQMTSLMDALADLAILQTLDEPVALTFDPETTWH